jgi:gas vesicle protein GvpO
MSEQGASRGANGKSGSGSNGNRALSPAAIARRSLAELAELVGGEAEGVTSLERTDDGWVVAVEVVEVRRIPDTSDVLAEYEVTTDRRGRLQSYRRARRYSRGSVQDN